MTFVLSLAFLSARPACSFFLLLTIPPPPTSNVWLPIKIHFFHFSPESDIPSGFLCFPISSVSLSHPSSTHWHVFFHRSPSHLCHLFPLPSLLTIALSDHLRKEWNSVPSPPIFISGWWEIMCITVRPQMPFFFFYIFIFPCQQAPTETTLICFGNRPTQISFWWMVTGAGLCWPVFFISPKKVSAF